MSLTQILAKKTVFVQALLKIIKEADKGVSEPPVEMENIIAPHLTVIPGIVSIDDMGFGRKEMSQHVIKASSPAILIPYIPEFLDTGRQKIVPSHAIAKYSRLKVQSYETGIKGGRDIFRDTRVPLSDKKVVKCGHPGTDAQ